MRQDDDPHSDATVRWMVDDVAARCRAVLDSLGRGDRTAGNAASAVQLGTAAMLLRGAADDLVAVVELTEQPARTPARRRPTAAPVDASRAAFDVSFDRVVKSVRPD